MKLFDSELRLMELIWDEDGITAKELSLRAAETIGWNKNTTYSVLKKLVAKDAVERLEPGFRCVARITREQVAAEETEGLISKLYRGSKKAFFAAFLQRENLSDAELDELRAMIDRHEE
jgi:predicted transcriptional regulator